MLISPALYVVRLPRTCWDPFGCETPEQKKWRKEMHDWVKKHVIDPVVPDQIERPVEKAFGGTMDAIGQAFQDAVGWFFRETSTWWVQIDSPDLEKEKSIGVLHGLFQGPTVLVAMMALLLVAGKMTLTRKANPLIDVGTGLSIVMVVSVIGVTLPNLLLQWTDEWSTWVLNASTGDKFAQRMIDICTTAEGVPGVIAFLLGLIALIIGAAQAVLLLFRQATLIILAGVLPLAAAGTLTPATRVWFRKIAGWMLSLIFYKAEAAAVYATAFTLIGEGKSLRATLTGFAMMILALIAFPVLMRMFTWTTGATDSGGGGSFLGAVVGGATALGALRGFGGFGPVGAAAATAGQAANGAGEHAAFLAGQLDEPGQGPAGGQSASGQQGQPTGGAGTVPGAGNPVGESAPAPPDPEGPTGGATPGSPQTEQPQRDERSTGQGNQPSGGTPGSPPGMATGSGADRFGQNAPSITWMNQTPFPDQPPSGGTNV